MVLMSVVPVVGKYQIGRDWFQLGLKDSLYVGTNVGKESVLKRFEYSLLEASPSKQISRGPRLGFPDSGRIEDDPIKLTFWLLLRQSQDRSATADLDVVGVWPQAENLQRTIFWQLQIQMDHARTDTAFDVSLLPLPL